MHGTALCAATTWHLKYHSIMDMNVTDMVIELLDAVWGPDWRIDPETRYGRGHIEAWARQREDAWDEAVEQVRKWRDHERV